MSDEVWKRDEPQSPCQGLCLIHPEAGICIGCLRSGAEISQWSQMSNAERHALLEQLPTRKTRLTPQRRGGRAGRAQGKGKSKSKG